MKEPFIPGDLRTAMERLFEQLDESEGGPRGTSTGFTDLDNMTGGLHPGELVILAARTGMGKSALAHNVADHVAVELGKGVMLFTPEMSRTEVAARMIMARGEINGKKFRGSYLSGEDRDELVKSSAKLVSAPIFFDDRADIAVQAIEEVTRLVMAKDKCSLVIVDNLHLIKPWDAAQPREDQLGTIVRQLRRFARETHTPVLCLSQLNRGFPDMNRRFDRRGNRPDLCHLRGSGVIEECADVVLFVHREEYYVTREEARDQNLIGQAELIVAKQRNGPVGDIKLHWFADFCKFKNVAQKAYDEFEQFGDF